LTSLFAGHCDHLSLAIATVFAPSLRPFFHPVIASDYLPRHCDRFFVPSLRPFFRPVIARPKGAAIWCTRNHSQDCFVATLLAMTIKEVIATVFRPVIATVFRPVIARPKAAAIWCTRITAQDCFVATLLAMTIKEVIATVFSSRHCEAEGRGNLVSPQSLTRLLRRYLPRLRLAASTHPRNDGQSNLPQIRVEVQPLFIHLFDKLHFLLF